MTEHIAPEQMLPYLDGELSNSARRKIGVHLESCWMCRREMERLQADIGLIVDAQHTVYSPGIQAPPPPQPWARLESSLATIKQRGFPAPRFFASWTPRRPLWTSVAFGTLACAVILAWLEPASVSAGEVVRLASQMDTQRMQATPGHFVRQRVRVTKMDRDGQRKQTGAVDSWRSARNGYWQFPPSDTAAADLQERYRRRGITQHPLCAKSFQFLSSNLAADGLVVRTADTLNVSYAEAGQSGGDLRNITLRVLPEEWRITGMRLEFDDADFDIVEENVALVPRDDTPNDVLARLEPPVPSLDKATLSGVVTPLPTPLLLPPVIPAPDERPLHDIEMDVLFTLHQLGADLGEPITVGKGADQVIVVQAWGAPESRRDLLRRVLQDNSKVRLELDPPAAPADLVEARPFSLTRAPLDVDRALRAANEELLVQWFGSAQAKEDFGRSVLVIATDMMVRFYALQALAERWPSTAEHSLSEHAISQLRLMVQNHTRMAQQRCAELKLVLKPLLDEFVPNEPAPLPVPSTDWQSAASAGLKASQETDLLLGSQFTTSDSAIPLAEALTRVRRALETVEALQRVSVPYAIE